MFNIMKVDITRFSCGGEMNVQENPSWSLSSGVTRKKLQRGQCPQFFSSDSMKIFPCDQGRVTKIEVGEALFLSELVFFSWSKIESLVVSN